MADRTKWTGWKRESNRTEQEIRREMERKKYNIPMSRSRWRQWKMMRKKKSNAKTTRNMCTSTARNSPVVLTQEKKSKSKRHGRGKSFLVTPVSPSHPYDVGHNACGTWWYGTNLQLAPLLYQGKHDFMRGEIPSVSQPILAECSVLMSTQRGSNRAIRAHGYRCPYKRPGRCSAPSAWIFRGRFCFCSRHHTTWCCFICTVCIVFPFFGWSPSHL